MIEQEAVFDPRPKVYHCSKGHEWTSSLSLPMKVRFFHLQDKAFCAECLMELLAQHCGQVSEGPLTIKEDK